MLNFWALSAIAAFCLREVLSINFGDPLNSQQPGGISPWGGSGGKNAPTFPNRGSGGSSPYPKYGDDKIRIYSVYHCIRIDNVPLCPGEDLILPKRDIIVESGYPPNSRSVVSFKPKWRDSWHIPEELGEVNKGAHLFFGSDYCLYNADILTQYKVFKIACAKYCYDGPQTRNPWSALGYGDESLDYSDQISGLEDRNRPHITQPCVKKSGKKTAFDPEEGAGIGSSAAFPVAAEAANEYHVQPGVNENTPLASTGFPDGFFNGFENQDSAAVADAGNFNDVGDVFDSQVKRSVPRRKRQQTRQILG